MSFAFFPWPWPYGYSPGAQFEIEPQGCYANATLRFVKLFPNFPAGYWSLQYGLVPSAGQRTGPITFQSSQLNGSDWHLIDVDSPATKAWIPGFYSWQCFAQINTAGAAALNLPATTRVFISKGTIEVYPDLTSAQSYDSRTQWQKILDEIDAMILATAGDTAWEVAIGRGTIAGQSIRAWTRDDLIKYRDYALHMAGNQNRIQARKGGAPNPRVKYGMFGGSQGAGVGNGFPDILPFS